MQSTQEIAKLHSEKEPISQFCNKRQEMKKNALVTYVGLTSYTESAIYRQLHKMHFAILQSKSTPLKGGMYIALQNCTTFTTQRFGHATNRSGGGVSTPTSSPSRPLPLGGQAIRGITLARCPRLGGLQK